METRIFLIELLLALASLITTANHATGQDKPRPETKPPAPKSADHATTGDQNAAGELNDPALKQAVIWPGMTRAGAVVLPNGWALNRPGARASSAICRSRSPCIRPSPTWPSSMRDTVSMKL